MAKIIDTYTTPEGETINVYESGAEYNASRGHLVKPAAGTVIRTAAQATEYNRRRREKTQRRTRARIVEEMNNGLLPPGTKVTDSAEATAEAAAVLWVEVVMNHDAYPRDRVITFEKLTQMMGTSPAAESAGDGTGQAAGEAADAGSGQAAAILARVLADVLRLQRGEAVEWKGEVIEGKLVE